MAPRAQASKGDGITIYEGWYQSPFGEVIAMSTDRGICGLGFASEMGRDVARSDLIKRWTAAHLKPANTQLDVDNDYSNYSDDLEHASDSGADELAGPTG